MLISGYSFNGPYSQTGAPQVAGVYVIGSSQGGKVRIIDVGESGDVGTRLSSHERQDCWQRNCSGSPLVYVHEEAGADRRRTIESAIRAQYNPACGER